MIPTADYLDVPLEPPVNIPTLPKMKTLGTVSDLAEELETHLRIGFIFELSQLVLYMCL